MDRAFGKVHHRCFSPHKKLQSVFNDVDWGRCEGPQSPDAVKIPLRSHLTALCKK